jgi:hypothetical protein
VDFRIERYDGRHLLSFSKSFDLVFSSNTLEHVERPHVPVA